MEQEISQLESLTEVVSVQQLLISALIIAGVWLLLKLFAALAERFAMRSGRYRLQISAAVPALRLVVWVATVYVLIVGVFQPTEANLIAMLASLGLAVGLASQDVIRNLISGVLILIEQPFRAGDMVQVGDTYGEVVNIGLRSVRIHTFDDNLVSIPNSKIAEGAVSNSNAGELDEMVVMSIALPASLDVQEMKARAREAALCSPYVFLKKPVNVVVADEFDRTFLTRYTIKAYVHDVRMERVFASDVIERLKKGLLDDGLITPELVMRLMDAPPLT